MIILLPNRHKMNGLPICLESKFFKKFPCNELSKLNSIKSNRKHGKIIYHTSQSSGTWFYQRRM